MQKFNSVLLLLFEWRFFFTYVHNVLCQYANVRALKTILHIFFLCTYKSREWQSSFVLVLCVLHIFSHCTICLQYCFFVFYKHETTRKKGTHTHTLVRSLAWTLCDSLIEVTHKLFTFAHCTHSIRCAVHNGHCCFSCFECFVARTTSNQINGCVYECTRRV